MKKSQSKFFIGSAIVVVAIAYLVYQGIEETSVYYLTVTEATASSKNTSEDLRIEGNVETGTIKKASNALGAAFLLADDAKKIPVNYKGTLPDLFGDGIDIVVQGRFDEKGVFNAYTLLTSCPSKYEASEGAKHPANVPLKQAL